jgi:N utilization substance protein B
VQALYQLDIAGTTLPDVLAELSRSGSGARWTGSSTARPMPPISARSSPAWCATSGRSIPSGAWALTPGWPLQRLDATLRAILRAGAYELTARADVPGRVVVSEYVDIARAFFDADIAGMVNAVLDAMARKLRPAEFSVDTSDAGA